MDMHPPVSYSCMDMHSPTTAAWICIVQLRLHGYANSSYGYIDMRPPATLHRYAFSSNGCMDMHPLAATAAGICILQLQLHRYAISSYGYIDMDPSLTAA
jgi:hypothetical protein